MCDVREGDCVCGVRGGEGEQVRVRVAADKDDRAPFFLTREVSEVVWEGVWVGGSVCVCEG